MIEKHERIFRDNVISYIYNRLNLISKDAQIAEEVINRFPVWVGFASTNKEDHRQLITFLVYGMRQMIRMKGNEDESESV
jgi:uncharacterized protein (DUF779 family)